MGVAVCAAACRRRLDEDPPPPLPLFCGVSITGAGLRLARRSDLRCALRAFRAASRSRSRLYNTRPGVVSVSGRRYERRFERRRCERARARVMTGGGKRGALFLAAGAGALLAVIAANAIRAAPSLRPPPPPPPAAAALLAPAALAAPRAAACLASLLRLAIRRPPGPVGRRGTADAARRRALRGTHRRAGVTCPSAGLARRRGGTSPSLSLSLSSLWPTSGNQLCTRGRSMREQTRLLQPAVSQSACARGEGAAGTPVSQRPRPERSATVQKRAS